MLYHRVVEPVFQTTHAFFTSRFDLFLKSFSPRIAGDRVVYRTARGNVYSLKKSTVYMLDTKTARYL